jgi:hypothetical protein
MHAVPARGGVEAEAIDGVADLPGGELNGHGGEA